MSIDDPQRYLEWIYSPRTEKVDEVLLGEYTNPIAKMVLGKSRWYVPLLVFPPLLWYVLLVREPLTSARLLWVLFGVLLFFPTEYLLHRFVFHLHVVGKRTQKLHLILHGVHHLAPKDLDHVRPRADRKGKTKRIFPVLWLDSCCSLLSSLIALGSPSRLNCCFLWFAIAVGWWTGGRDAARACMRSLCRRRRILRGRRPRSGPFCGWWASPTRPLCSAACSSTTSATVGRYRLQAGRSGARALARSDSRTGLGWD